MIVYEFYCLNPRGDYQIIGVLPERRKDTMRITKDSVTNWGRMILGDGVDRKNIFFKRLTISSC